MGRIIKYNVARGEEGERIKSVVYNSGGGSGYHTNDSSQNSNSNEISVNLWGNEFHGIEDLNSTITVTDGDIYITLDEDFDPADYDEDDEIPTGSLYVQNKVVAKYVEADDILFNYPEQNSDKQNLREVLKTIGSETIIDENTKWEGVTTNKNKDSYIIMSGDCDEIKYSNDSTPDLQSFTTRNRALQTDIITDSFDFTLQAGNLDATRRHLIRIPQFSRVRLYDINLSFNYNQPTLKGTYEAYFSIDEEQAEIEWVDKGDCIVTNTSGQVINLIVFVKITGSSTSSSNVTGECNYRFYTLTHNIVKAAPNNIYTDGLTYDWGGLQYFYASPQQTEICYANSKINISNSNITLSHKDVNVYIDSRGLNADSIWFNYPNDNSSRQNLRVLLNSIGNRIEADENDIQNNTHAIDNINKTLLDHSQSLDKIYTIAQDIDDKVKATEESIKANEEYILEVDHKRIGMYDDIRALEERIEELERRVP